MSTATPSKPALPLEAEVVRQNGDMVKAEERKIGAASEPNPLIAEAMRIEGLTLVERLALIDKVEEVYWKRQKTEAEAAYSAAMSLAQSEMGQVIAKSNNPQTHSKYAKYDAVDKVIRPVYTKHGFSLSFKQGEGAPSEHIRLVCRVAHGGGHVEYPYLDLSTDGKGAKGGDVMTKIHAAGNGISYGKRYLAGMIFNLAITENDNDGNGPPPEVITEKQVAELKQLAKDTKSSIPKLLAYFKIDKIENLPASLYESAVTAFKKRGAEIATKQAARTTLQLAPPGEAIEPSTVKTLTAKMEHAALSIGDFRNRFGLTKVEQVNRTDINLVLAWIIDPQNA